MGDGMHSNKELRMHMTKNNCESKSPSTDEPEWLNEEQEPILEEDWHTMEGDNFRQQWYSIYARFFPGVRIPCACKSYLLLCAVLG